MKTQISRDSFQPDKRYSGIHQQQGRMMTDADWNELMAICREQLVQALADLVGNGSPRHGALAVTADRKIQPGDIYLDGIRAELPGSAPLAASAQPDLPGYPDLPATGPYTIYGDLWERVVTSLEDASLRDPGLHGADTCTRTQTMLQVKICPETVNPESGIPHRGNATLALTLHSNLEKGDPCDPCAGLISAGRGRVGSYLFRLEVHGVEGSASNPTRLILKWSSENGAEQYQALAVDKMPPGFVAGSYVYEFHDLTSEKHLGVFLGSGFTPTRGVIKSVYEIPDSPPRELVRRWDGFCELTRSGGSWALASGVDRGVALTTTGSATAPGHVVLGSSIRINLESLQLTLDLSGKSFIAGDFWLAPVREAVDGPGDAVLSSAEPRGIVHHYLRLARVLADGTVVHFDNDADKRRHRFPPLTDLHAHDVGYQTSCSSGLFDASHDNVEKALNRLCQLAAEHVAYTSSCTKGLYAGFSGTVKQALDEICGIQASQVGFTKPCDTSIYQGSTIATVEDALKLLCSVTAGQIGFTKPCDTSVYQGKSIATVQDALQLLCNVTAGQIAYTPGGSCTFLNQPGIDTVQDALDALCARPTGGGGCRITVGKGGGFETLEDALKALLEKERDICLCLLPGDHLFPGQLIAPQESGINLCLSGCGHATRLLLEKEPARFRGFAALSLSDLEIITHDSTNGALIFNRCRDVSLKGVAVYGFITEGFLVGVNDARTVAMHGLELEASGPGSLAVPAKLFDLNNTLFDLFQVADWTFFHQKVVPVAQIVAALPAAERQSLAQAIGERVKGMAADLSDRERQSYVEFASRLSQPDVSAVELAASLETIRREAIRESPAVALVFDDAGADLTLGECDILGIVTLYGTHPAGPLPGGLVKTFDTLVKQGEATFGGLGTTFRVAGCRMTRMDVSTVIQQRIKEIVASGGGKLPNLFSSALLGDLTLLQGNNQMAFLNSSLSSSVFQAGSGRAALVMGSSTIYVGNRGEGEAVIVNLTPQGRSERVANLGISISG